MSSREISNLDENNGADDDGHSVEAEAQATEVDDKKPGDCGYVAPENSVPEPENRLSVIRACSKDSFPIPETFLEPALGLLLSPLSQWIRDLESAEYDALIDTHDLSSLFPLRMHDAEGEDTLVSAERAKKILRERLFEYLTSLCEDDPSNGVASNALRILEGQWILEADEE